MAEMTPVYYLQSGQMKFWQEEGTISSATVITPNAIVAKKQSIASVSYNPYEKSTIITVYKGEAEVADLATGKKMLLKPVDDSKPRVAVISFNSILPTQTQEPRPVALKQSSSGLNIGVLIALGIAIIVLGYIVVRKKSYLVALYNNFKQKLKNIKESKTKHI